MELSSGRLCRFKARDKWPPLLQQTIPKDKLYFIHPVIILDTAINGHVDVVTTTSSPALSTNAANYLRISASEKMLPNELHAPLSANYKLPKESWVVLDSKRNFPVTILQPWMEGEAILALGSKNARKRLRQYVDARMKSVAQQEPTSVTIPAEAPPPPPPTTCKPSTPASTNPWARAMVSPGPPPSTPLPPLPPLAVAVKVRPATPSSTLGRPPSPPPRTTSLLPLQPTSPKSEEDIDIADIKRSLSGLKVAVAALEGLCEKLEARTETTSTHTLSPSPGYASHLVPRDGKAERLLGMNSEPAMTTEKTVGAKKEGKTLRLKRWGSRLFMIKGSQ